VIAILSASERAHPSGFVLPAVAAA